MEISISMAKCFDQTVKQFTAWITKFAFMIIIRGNPRIHPWEESDIALFCGLNRYEFVCLFSFSDLYETEFDSIFPSMSLITK